LQALSEAVAGEVTEEDVVSTDGGAAIIQHYLNGLRQNRS
jgi:hypothetical protein